MPRHPRERTCITVDRDVFVEATAQAGKLETSFSRVTEMALAEWLLRRKLPVPARLLVALSLPTR